MTVRRRRLEKQVKVA